MKKNKLKIKDSGKREPDTKPDKGEIEKYTDSIVEMRKTSWSMFEKQLVYISGGAIALCIALLQAEQPIIAPNNISWFTCALGCFCLALLVNLISHRTSIYVTDLELRKEQNKSDYWDKITDCLNTLSIGFVIFGLVSIFITVLKIEFQ
jgi:hypothetical protein